MKTNLSVPILNKIVSGIANHMKWPALKPAYTFGKFLQMHSYYEEICTETNLCNLFHKWENTKNCLYSFILIQK